MTVKDLIARLAQQDLGADVLMPDGLPVSISAKQPTCGVVYITDDTPDEDPFDRNGMVKHDKGWDEPE